MTLRQKGRHWAIGLNGQTLLKQSIMSKLETARKLARQTAERGTYTEKERQEVQQAMDYIVKALGKISENQKILSEQQHSLGDGLSRKLAPIDSLEKWMQAMENTQMDLVKQQYKTRILLMAIFFTGIVPLLAFITALVLKVLVLT